MPKIALNHDSSLIVDESTNQLGIRESHKQGSSLEIRNNGLFAEQRSGSGSDGFPDGYRSENGIESGIDMPDSVNTSKSRRLVGPTIIHRIFTCTDVDGTYIHIRYNDEPDEETNFDLILPGDMYRVFDSSNDVYNYYVILKTDGAHVITHSPVVASVPSNASCN
jgi:hypothetical protein